MKVSEIDYRTEIVRPYVEAITACTTKAELVHELTENWSELCPDALAQANKLRDDEEWRWALKHKKRRRDVKRVIELAGAILVPKTLLAVSGIAVPFCVPDGCAYIRMQEVMADEIT